MSLTAQKLIIDARPLSRGKGGIQRYLEETLVHIAAEPSLAIVLYIDAPPSPWLRAHQTLFHQVRYPLLSRWSRYRFFRAWIKTSWKWRVLFWLRRDRPAIFWSPRHHLPLWLPKSCYAVVTVHDLVWKVFPQTMPTLKRRVEQVLMPRALYRADAIIAVSDTTRDRILRYFPDIAATVTTIRHGVSLAELPQHDVSLPVQPDNYFLAVGTIEPRKNYLRLLQAFEIYVAGGGVRELRIVGKRGWKTEPLFSALAASPAKERIRILSAVTDEQLIALYRQAAGFVMVSLDEGFGLPALEARYYRLPALLADIEVFRELFPATELWADPLDITDMAAKLGQLETASAVAATEPTRLPSWREAAAKIAAVLQQTNAR